MKHFGNCLQIFAFLTIVLFLKNADCLLKQVTVEDELNSSVPGVVQSNARYFQREVECENAKNSKEKFKQQKEVLQPSELNFSRLNIDSSLNMQSEIGSTISDLETCISDVDNGPNIHDAEFVASRSIEATSFMDESFEATTADEEMHDNSNVMNYKSSNSALYATSSGLVTEGTIASIIKDRKQKAFCPRLTSTPKKKRRTHLRRLRRTFALKQKKL